MSRRFDPSEALAFGIRWETLRARWFEQTGRPDISQECQTKAGKLEAKLWLLERS